MYSEVEMLKLIGCSVVLFFISSIAFFEGAVRKASAMDVCAVSELAPKLEDFSLLMCNGSLGHQEAVDCLNRYVEKLEEAEHRERLAMAQAECLCSALNEIVDGFGTYNRLRGSCSVER